MICELGLCVFLQGGLGIQEGFDVRAYGYDVKEGFELTNSYGLVTGEISLRMQYDNWVFEPWYHLSGVNQEEWDYGMNAAFVGYEWGHDSGFYVRPSVGIQAQLDIPKEGWKSNEYGRYLFKLQAGYIHKSGIYAQYGRIDEMQHVTVGITSRLK